MSYGYGQNNQQGYGQSHGYGQHNPYDQRNDYPPQGGYSPPQGAYNSPAQGYAQGNPYAQQSSYGQQRPPFQQQHSSQYGDESGHEMGVLDNDPNRILNAATRLRKDIERVDRRTKDLDTLKNNSHDGGFKAISEEMEKIQQEYRTITNKTIELKKDPASRLDRNAGQMKLLDQELRAAIDKLRSYDSQIRRQRAEQVRRDVLNTNPNANEYEIRQAQEEDDYQVYAMNIQQSDRRGQAQTARQNVESRHAAIAKIEKSMMELSTMIQDLDSEVVRQDPQIAAIEDKAEVAQEHVTQGTVELDGAIVKAKAARKKKWICLGIVVLIILIVIGVAVGVVEANRNKGP